MIQTADTRKKIMELLLSNFHHTVLGSELQELADELMVIVEEREKALCKIQKELCAVEYYSATPEDSSQDEEYMGNLILNAPYPEGIKQ